MSSRSQPIEQRLKQSLQVPEARAELEKVLPDILSNLRDRDTQISKRLTLLAAAIFFLELAKESQISEISVLGVSLKDLSTILKFGAAGISFLFFYTMSLIATRRVLLEAYNAGFKTLYPNLYNMDMEIYTTPQTSSKLYEIVQIHLHGLWKTVAIFSRNLNIIIMVIAPSVYIIWKIADIAKFGNNDIGDISSMALSAFFLFQSYMLMFATVKAIHARPAHGVRQP